jgi:hypothetical protein
MFLNYWLNPIEPSTATFTVRTQKEPCRQQIMIYCKPLDIHEYMASVVARCVVSVFRQEVHQNCALLGRYTASSANSLPTFLDNLLVQSSRVKNSWIHDC